MQIMVKQVMFVSKNGNFHLFASPGETARISETT